VQLLAEGKSMKRGRECAARDPANGCFSQISGHGRAKSRNDCGADSVRYKITNSHNVKPTEEHCPCTASIAGPPAFLLFTLHRCSGEPNTGNIFREKGRHLIAQAVFWLMTIGQTQRSLNRYIGQAAKQPTVITVTFNSFHKLPINSS